MSFWLPDSRLEMPELMHPGRKPVGTAKIDKSHRHSKGLVGYWMMDGSNTDLTKENHGEDVGAIGRGFGVSGDYCVINNDNSTDRIDLGLIDADNPLSCSKNNEISILVIAEFLRNSHGNTYPRFIDKSSAGGAVNGYSFYVYSNKIQFQINSRAKRSVGSISNGESRAVGITHGNNETRFFIEKKYDSSRLNTKVIPSTATNASLLNWNHAADRQYMQPVYLIAVWDRRLSDLDMISMQGSPYQILIPQ